MREQSELIDLTPALRTWAFRNGITPKEFQKRMGYKFYSHAWNVVSKNGKGIFSDKAWGRFIWGYGLPAFLELAAIAKADMEQSHA